MHYVLSSAIVAFLGLNIALRSYVLHCYDVPVFVVLCLAGVVTSLVWRFPGFLKVVCFVFGLSIPLFGFQSYTLQNQIFEYCIVVLAGLFWLSRSGRLKLLQGTGPVEWILASYIVLAFFSLLLLPYTQFVEILSLWEILDFSNLLFTATPENPLYSLAAVNRLFLFFLCIFLIKQIVFAEILYNRLFTGVALSVLAACLLGLGNQFGLYSLEWYRPQFVDLLGAEQRLQSVFANPGWFAEYVVIGCPLLLFFGAGKGGLKSRFFLLSILFAFVGSSVLLTGSRASWIVFVFVALCCSFWLLLTASGREGYPITWANFRRASLRVGLVGVSVCLIVASLLLFVEKKGGDQHESLSRTEYLLERIRTLATPGERAKLWQESILLVAESPVYGMGYEGYRWHQEVLDTIPDSRFSQGRQTTNNWDTSHNFYLQLLASNGIAGLLIWSFLAVYVGLLFFLAGILKRNIKSFALLTALFAFHLYGLAQSMQYIASIWLLFFLLIGYASLTERRLDVPWLKWTGRVGTVAVVVAVLIGILVYNGNRKSHLLAERYDLSHYGSNRTDIQYKGFYPRENWGSDGFFRWTGKAAEIQFLQPSGTIQIDFACYAPRLEHTPITLSVILDGLLVDQYVFLKGEKVTRKYILPAQNDGSSVTMQLLVSRTWNPKREKINSDTRNLGIAVGEPAFIQALPAIPLLLFR